MKSKHNGVPEREQRLDAVVAAYLQAVEAGQQPDRQELLVRHEDLLPELAQFFEDADALGGLAPRSRSDKSAGASVSETITEGKELGDFRIVREVGKGGMGIVYEAEQLSLRRRVALKILPFAATMDPRHLQRFHNEAQAAACLHHANIVPVYFVGCERSVHFYAMQFIEGQSLAELIAVQKHDLASGGRQPPVGNEQGADAPRSPDAVTLPIAIAITQASPRDAAHYRRIAEWGIQAAEALEHAHSLGIVHRDIKPANLMIDARGVLWITDFGLARTTTDAGLTMTGDVLGTLRYMSPEQALAKHGLVDHRSDIYALGATLYELLTLRPATEGKDREEILRKITFEEPLPPRSHDRTIAADLETIICKAMAKEPAERYATAQELAEDLRRWLLDQPIRARRPSPVQVVRKWLRRHQAAVWAATLLLFVLMVVGVVNVLWWSQQQMEEAEKQAAAETKAREALNEATHLQQNEQWPEALSAIRRAQEVLHGFVADADLHQEIDQRGKDLEMARRLEETRLQNTAVKDGQFYHDASIGAYEAAFAWYGLDVEHEDASAAVEFIRSRSIAKQLMAALDDWARLQRQRRGQHWKHLLAVARAVDADEWRNRLRDAWEHGDGKAMNNLPSSAKVESLQLGSLNLVDLSSYKHEKFSAEKWEPLLRQAQQRYPADFWVNHNLAMLLAHSEPAQLEDAIGYFRAAVALRPQSPAVHSNFAQALYKKGRLDEAIAECCEAIRLNKDFAEAHSNLGIVLSDKGRLDDAIVEFREAIQLREDFAGAHYNLGNTLMKKGELGEAIAEYHKTIRLRPDYAEVHINIGIALARTGRLDEAIGAFREAIHLKKDFAEAHNNLGNALREKGQLDEAIAEFREAIQLKKDYAGAHNNLGFAFLIKGQFNKAIAEFREAIHFKQDFALAHNNLRQAEQMARLDECLPRILEGKEKPKDAAERLSYAWLCQQDYKKRYAAAARFYSDAFTEEPKLADDLGAQHRYNAACAATLAGCGQSKDADKLDAKECARLRRQALEWLREDLKAYRRVLEESAGKAGPMIAQNMQHWLLDGDFTGVRGDKALAKLPEVERKEWQKHWQEVEVLRQRAAQQPKTTKFVRP